MTYLIDTDWVIDYLKLRPGATQMLRSLRSAGLAISLITFGEVYEGIYRGVNQEAHESGFLDFLRRVDVLPLDRDIMVRFARIRGDLRRHGRPVGDLDLLIAATAIQHDLTLVTRNIREYGRVPDLKLYQSGP